MDCLPRAGMLNCGGTAAARKGTPWPDLGLSVQLPAGSVHNGPAARSCADNLCSPWLPSLALPPARRS